MVQNIVYAIIVIMLLAVSVLSRRKKCAVGRKLANVCLLGALCVLFYIGTYSYQNDVLQKYMRCLYTVATGCVIVCLADFVRELLNYKLYMKTWIIIFVFFALDGIAFLLTPQFEIMATFREEIVFGKTIMRFEPKLWYYVHLLMYYFLLFKCIASLISRASRTNRYYRGGYVTMACVMSVIGVLGVFDYVFESILGPDMAIPFYAIAGGFTYLNVFYLTPHRQRRDMRAFVTKQVCEPLVVFNDKDELLGMNDAAQELLGDKEFASREEFLDVLKLPATFEKEKLSIRFYTYEVKQNTAYDERERLIARVYAFHDVTEIEEAYIREHRAATVDALTEIPNRNGFFGECRRRIRNRNDYVLIVFGIYNFKGINGLYGSEVGDRILKFLAGRITLFQSVAPVVGGRTGGAIFSAALREDEKQRFIEELSDCEFEYGEYIKIHLDLHFGYIRMDDMSRPMEYYYERARIACNKSKDSVTDKLYEYDARMEEEMRLEQTLISDMYNALAHDEFFLELQPQHYISDERIEGAEALVRWNHPELGRIPPGIFIGIFEQNGFISRLDEYVWNKAAELIHRFEEEDSFHGSISVNVSQVDIMSLDVVSIFEDIVKRHEIDPGRLHIEITESACANERKKLIDTLNNLRAKGFIVEIDDFGSGYSSLNAITELPFDVVKMDLKFMKGIEEYKEVDGILLTSLAGMLHKLNATVIMEGVETRENVERARDAGCDIIQGYFYSKPLPVDAFISYVREHKGQ